MYTKKFYDMEASDVMSSGETDAPAAESAPSEAMSIAAIMAKEGVKSSSDGTESNLVRINRDGSWESESGKAESPVAPTKDEAKSEPVSESSKPAEIEVEVPEPQKEEVSNTKESWQSTIKGQQPEDVLKALGFDDKTVSFIKELKDVDPKMVNFLNTWKEKGNVTEYLNEVAKDYSQMPAEDVMRHQLREEYPKASEAQLDVLYKKEIVEKYNLNSYDEDEAAEGKLLLDAKADKYRDNLVQSQKERLLPEPKENESNKFEEQRRMEVAQGIVKEFNDNPYTKEVIAKNSITIGEGADKFSFPIDSKAVTDLVINGDANGELMFDKKTNANGEEVYIPKAQHQLLVATVNKYGEKFITELAKHYKSLGGKAAIEPIDNARPVETRNTSNASPEPTSIVGAMAKYGKLN